MVSSQGNGQGERESSTGREGKPQEMMTLQGDRVSGMEFAMYPKLFYIFGNLIIYENSNKYIPESF